MPIKYQVGDILWGKETFCELDYPDHAADSALPRDAMVYGRRNGAAYAADTDTEGNRIRKAYGYKWKSSLFMPHWASRITLEITGVRIEQVQAITVDDAIAEGIDSDGGNDESTIENYRILWDSLHKDAFQWARNPWVYVLEFRRAIEA